MFLMVAERNTNFGYPGIVIYFVGLRYLLGRLGHLDLRMHPNTIVFFDRLLWLLVKADGFNAGNDTPGKRSHSGHKTASR